MTSDATLVRSLKQMYFYIDRLTIAIRRPYIRTLASINLSRVILNWYYNLLNPEAKSRFHARYAKIFRNHQPLASGKWIASFAGRKIIMPLKTFNVLARTRDSAVSIAGHDSEIKQTYEDLINSDQRPTLFLDVGANYGTHSILFLSIGIKAIAFEPNQQCVSIFLDMCRVNGFVGRWEPVAIGKDAGDIELVYPEKDTWLGTVSAAASPTLKGSSDLRTEIVPLRRLDDYIADVSQNKTLIKIDVQGYEREVIQGASQLLRRCKPKIIFVKLRTWKRG